MVIDESALASLQAEADRLWKESQAADSAAKQTAEALLHKTLIEQWLQARKRIDAMKLLLEHEQQGRVVQSEEPEQHEAKSEGTP